MISLISGKYDGFSKGGETVIEFQNVTKTYRVMKRQAGFGSAVKALFSREHETIQALCDVSFTVGDGEIVGYIGPNGAGKSTTVKIMCGILTPDSGRCLVNGRVPWRERTAHTREIGVVFGQRSQLWWDVPVIDSFELLRDMYRVEPARYKRNLDALAALLGLGELLKVRDRGLAAARPENHIPRRADDRAGCRVKARGAPVHPRAEPGARHDRCADDARHAGY